METFNINKIDESVVLANILAYIIKEGDAPASSETHLNKALFEVMKGLSESDLEAISKERGHAYRAFKKMTMYPFAFNDQDPLRTSIREFNAWKIAYQVSLSEPCQDFIFKEGGLNPYAVGYITLQGGGSCKVLVIEVDKIDQEQQSYYREVDDFTHHFNFTDPSKPPFYLTLKPECENTKSSPMKKEIQKQ